MTTCDLSSITAEATSDRDCTQKGSSGPVARFNNWLAVLITKSVGTTWAAYLFVLIALVSLPQAFAAFVEGDTVTGIAWFSQSFLQLVLLPIILVGQNVISTTQNVRAQQAELETATALQTLQAQQRELLEAHESLLMLLDRQGGSSPVASQS